MAAGKYIDRVCAACLVLALALTVLAVNSEALGLQAAGIRLGYEDRLFDASRVHTIDIVMDDWEAFLETCENEAYSPCSLVIDGEAQRSAAIRAKGNTSLTSVAAYGNDRYSFKVEFDHYDSGSTYYGLDKLNLNNLIQDNTCMKDFLSYQLMARFGAAAPLCSYASVSVNGEPWGLYLAVEAVEDAFLQRQYGRDTGSLYKPDSMSMGGSRGSGGGFAPEAMDFSPFAGVAPEGRPAAGGDGPVQETGRGRPGGEDGQSGMGSSDVKLQYIDDDPDSYPNIFDNAKTAVTDADKDRLIASLEALSRGERIEEVVDVEQVIRYFVVHGFLCNGDSYTGSMVHNYYLYEKDGVLSMIPWDYNLAFGGFQAGSDAGSVVNEPIDTPVTGGAVEDRPMLAWIFADEAYTALYHQYYAEFLAECLDSGWCRELIVSTAALIAPYVAEDPTAFCTYEEFQAGAAALEDFCRLRAQSVSGQLEGAIPSTAQGQAEDPAALVDASGLELTDMGSMGAGMGGGQDRPLGEAADQPPERRETAPAFGPAGGAAVGGGPGLPAGTSGSPAAGAWLPLLLSAAVLAGGLGFTLCFRRRGR